MFGINATEAAVHEAILLYSTLLNEEDQLLLFFAGHGDFDSKFDDGFVVLSNSKTTLEDPYRRSYIQFASLQKLINKLPPKQILTVFDICFGGTFDNQVTQLANRGSNHLYENLTNEQFLFNKSQYKSRIYITSGGKNEVHDGYAGKHSPFALKFLEALHTHGGKNGLLTANDLYSFVNKLPSGPLLGHFGDHEIGGEFILTPQNTVSED